MIFQDNGVPVEYWGELKPLVQGLDPAEAAGLERYTGEVQTLFPTPPPPQA